MPALIKVNQIGTVTETLEALAIYRTALVRCAGRLRSHPDAMREASIQIAANKRDTPARTNATMWTGHECWSTANIR
jgi:hypothetical protein